MRLSGQKQKVLLATAVAVARICSCSQNPSCPRAASRGPGDTCTCRRLNYRRRILNLGNESFVIINKHACPLSRKETSSLLYWIVSTPAPCSKGSLHPCLPKLFTIQTSWNKNSQVQKRERSIENCFLTVSTACFYTILDSGQFTHASVTPTATLIKLTNQGWDQINSIYLMQHLLKTIINRAPFCQEDILASG